MIVALVCDSLALIITLSVLILLVFWQSWQTRSGRALLQLVGCLFALHSMTLLVQAGIALELPDTLLAGFGNLTLLAFWLVTLTALAVLLQAAARHRDAWVVIHRAGVVGLVAIQPALWAHDVIQHPGDLDHTPFTDLGNALLAICAVYVVFVFVAGWRYWRRIDAPLLAGPVLGIATIQAITLITGLFRGLTLTNAVGAAASLMIGYHLISQPTLIARTPQLAGANILNAVSGSLASKRLLAKALADVAAYARHMVRTDNVSVLVAVAPDRLEVVATDGTLPALTGRQIHIGEGLAGRVMQTLHAMRIDNYRTWNGRSPAFENLPLHASISIPLIFRETLVGVINAHETSPGRVFTERDQMLLELVAPQAAIVIAIANLENEHRSAQAYLQVVLENSAAAIMIFDTEGRLHTANETARRYLDMAFGDDSPPPSVNELAARAHDTRFTEALVQSTAHPNHAFAVETEYPQLGRVSARVQRMGSEQRDLLVILQQAEE